MTIKVRKNAKGNASFYGAETIKLMRLMVLLPSNRIEKFHVSFFDEENSFLGDRQIGQSGCSSVLLRTREIMSTAMELGAYGMLLAHNHPSGNCRPSECDIEATLQLQTISRALDVLLIDHLIFTKDEVYSMRAGGLL